MPDGDIYPDLKKESLDLHEKNRGKIEIRCKIPLETKWDLSRAYTPGVADVCRAIQNDKNTRSRQILSQSLQTELLSSALEISGQVPRFL